MLINSMGVNYMFFKTMFIFLFFFLSYSYHLSVYGAFSTSPSSDKYNSNQVLCRAEQTHALLQFKQNLESINDPTFSYVSDDEDEDESCEKIDFCCSNYPKLMTWNTSTDCCRWDGVTCNQFTGDVIGLDLSCSMLQGTIDFNRTLFHLPHLHKLNLAWNNFYPSQLPHEITARFSKSLTHLNLSNSLFSGQIPSGISLLPHLVSLDLSSNRFDSGLEPRVFNHLLQNSSQLRELSLVAVNISSVLPTYLNVSSLRFLDLRGTGLHGKLPDNIFDLPYLQKLDLSWNFALTGPFPKVNRNTSIPLKLLDLSRTGLSGEIPDSIGHLTSLNTLILSHCNFEGTLPKSIGSLMHLTTLRVSSNFLEGTLLPSLFTLPSLVEIDLSDNMLNGKVPPELFTHRSLKSLLLGSNQFVGQIDVHDQDPVAQSFLQFVNLTSLDLSYNNFTGVWELDTLFSYLTTLQHLDLSYSGLSVVITEANHYVNPKFSSLLLASCKLTVFPESLRAMKKLVQLDLSNNEIHGNVPDWAGEIGGNQLYHLNLSHNFITGLPQLQWGGLNYVYLKSNMIQGPFPSSLCNMSDLEILDLSNNSFGGVIPKCFGYLMSSLWMVDLGNNDFHGSIPNVYADCPALGGLNLNGNRLKGKVPSSLAKCSSLEVLDLGNNHLNDTFPGWLQVLPLLQVLVLKGNRFHGPIRSHSMTTELPFPELRILDLSENEFAGRLPERYFRNFKAMSNIDSNSTKPKYLVNRGGQYYSITMVLKGVQTPFWKIFVAYTVVDLSNNAFQVEIPDAIGRLGSLKVLNLSHNSLTGRIPQALGSLSEVESLDLSWNQLMGEIPQEFVGLKSLAILNLSQNHLVGRIPQGKQFNTFGTDSYGGNPSLCGFPLPRNCGGNQQQQPLLPQPEDVSDSESGFTWQVVLLGYGSGTLLGIVMGYLMFATGRPRWFNAFVEAEERRIQRRQKRRKVVRIGR